MADADHFPAANGTDEDMTGTFKTEMSEYTLVLVHQGQNALSRQRGGRTVCESKDETLITESSVAAIFDTPHTASIRRRPSIPPAYQRVYLDLLGIGMKVTKNSYKQRLKHLQSIKEESKLNRRFRGFDVKNPDRLRTLREQLYQESYTPLPLSLGCWFKEELAWFVDAEDQTATGPGKWFDMESHRQQPCYNHLDIDALDLCNYLLEDFQTKNIACALQKTSETFGRVLRRWAHSSKSNYYTSPIIARAPGQEDSRLYGIVVRAPHFATKTSTTVGLITLQLCNKPTIQNLQEKYRHYTFFEARHPYKQTRWLAVKRHSTTLLKVNALFYCQRALIAPLDTLSKGLNSRTKDSSSYGFYRTHVWTGEEVEKVSYQKAMSYHVCEQFLMNLYSSSQLSAFVAEIRRCTMAKCIAYNGELYMLGKNGKAYVCTEKASECVIGNPMVLYLTNAWNCQLPLSGFVAKEEDGGLVPSAKGPYP